MEAQPPIPKPGTETPRAKSGKREVGACLLLAALAIAVRYWTLDDPELIKAFSGAYNGAMFTLIPTGLLPFGLHYVVKRD